MHQKGRSGHEAHDENTYVRHTEQHGQPDRRHSDVDLDQTAAARPPDFYGQLVAAHGQPSRVQLPRNGLPTLRAKLEFPLVKLDRYVPRDDQHGNLVVAHILDDE